MKLLLIVLMLVATGCTSSKLWLAGYDEDRAKVHCRLIAKVSKVDSQEEMNRCLAQSKNAALAASVPVVFTVPLLP